MSKAITLSQRAASHSVEIARTVIVSACALALIAAGQALPL